MPRVDGVHPPAGRGERRDQLRHAVRQGTDLDPVLTLLIVLLGALIAYVLDEILIVTPRISAWIGRVMGES